MTWLLGFHLPTKNHEGPSGAAMIGIGCAGGLVRAGGGSLQDFKSVRGEASAAAGEFHCDSGSETQAFGCVMCNEENPEENPAKLWNHRMFYFLKSRLRCKVGQAARYRT